VSEHLADFDSPEMLNALEELEKGNHAEAFALLVPLANAGNPRAQCNLATLYHLGRGVQKDGRKAIELYRRVAEQGIREACLSGVAYNNLATIYFTGLPGIEPNPEKAREYLAHARELGFEM
jgi:TPR repeat protein